MTQWMIIGNIAKEKTEMASHEKAINSEDLPLWMSLIKQKSKLMLQTEIETRATVL